MANMSDYLENGLISHVLRNTTLTSPSNTYLGLFTSANGLENNNLAGSDEVSGGSYVRATLAPSIFTAPSGGVSSNNADVTYPTATGAWGVITHVAIIDAATNGNVLLWAPLTVSKDVRTGDAFEIPTSDLDVTFE